MDEQELIKLWYDDIKQSSEPWFDRLFEFPDHEATYGKFFDVLPEPLRECAREECELNLSHTVKLCDLFDQGFTWSEAEHGKAWNRLYRAIDRRLHGNKIEIPTVDYLLSSVDDD